MRLEVADIRGDCAAVLASVPVDRDERDWAAGALLKKWRKPIESYRDSGAVCADAVGYAGGAKFDTVASVLFHILVEARDSGADVHVRLAHIIGFVEGHEIAGPGPRGCGFDGRVPFVRVDRGSAPQGGYVLELRREALRRVVPIVAPNDRTVALPDIEISRARVVCKTALSRVASSSTGIAVAARPGVTRC